MNNFMFSNQEAIPFFERALFEATGKNTTVDSFQFLGGGNINNAIKLLTSQGVFFLKWNENSEENMFEPEAKGLNLLKSAEAITIPEIIGYGEIQGKYYLALEFIQSAPSRLDYWEVLGQSLAKIHQNTTEHFGLHFNNYIGALKQSNEPYHNGVSFFIDKRLRVQAGLAFYNEKISKKLYDKFENLYEKLPEILPEEKPALLHGDLWSGNVMVGNVGEPTLIDPAVYYGLRETEIAFTKLFGGFDSSFYQAYQENFPLEKGFEERVPIYNLYPLLVHLNIFGSGYLSGIERVLEKF